MTYKGNRISISILLIIFFCSEINWPCVAAYIFSSTVGFSFLSLSYFIQSERGLHFHENVQKIMIVPQYAVTLFICGILIANQGLVIRLLSMLRNDYVRWELIVIPLMFVIIILECLFIFTEIKISVPSTPIK